MKKVLVLSLAAGLAAAAQGQQAQSAPQPKPTASAAEQEALNIARWRGSNPRASSPRSLPRTSTACISAPAVAPSSICMGDWTRSSVSNAAPCSRAPPCKRSSRTSIRSWRLSPLRSRPMAMRETH